jgi:hypothetical protein
MLPPLGSGLRGADVSAAVLNVLTDIHDWRLSPARWKLVGDILWEIHSALGSGDEAQLESALVDLELAGPVRIVRIGAAVERIAAPPDIRERINRLQHSIATPESRNDPR